MDKKTNLFFEFERKLRMQNLRDALQLGILGKNSQEIFANVRKYMRRPYEVIKDQQQTKKEQKE